MADVWDALTADRAYRTGWDPVAALTHLTENAGKLSDRAVVEVMVDHANRELGQVLSARVGVGREAA